MRQLRIVAALLALGLVAAACGNDGDGGNQNASLEDDREQVEANDPGANQDAPSDEARAYAEAIAASNEDDLADVSEEEELCVGFALVDAIGVDQLVASGRPDELFDDPDASLADLGISFSEDQADAFWDEFNNCVDVRQFFFDSMRAEQDMPEEAIACLERELSDDFLKRTLVTTMVSGEEALDNDEQLISEIADALATCPEAAASDQ